ncbi:hypothetical protein SASPL_124244 [Salvia splendens]|uniref:VQ domain-containing protein n=1 Tax=Salvia splendens TaxID=180675 RepID=A0A8X8ZUS7_SALSN|nr:hypothetical protein SASPL_124244 [Salvia splendens]
MGKKSSQAAMKAPNNKKQQSNSLMKILRPKVFITDSSNFKTLVQQLTGNATSNSSASPPPPPPHESFDVSFDSSCFGTPLEGSPDSRELDSFEYGFDFSSQIMDLESLLMEIDSMDCSNASFSAPFQQENMILRLVGDEFAFEILFMSMEIGIKKTAESQRRNPWSLISYESLGVTYKLKETELKSETVMRRKMEE